MLFAGLDDLAFNRLLSELVALSMVVVHTDEDTIELVHLAAAVKARSSESDRRRAGWKKRRAAIKPAVKPEPAEPARPAPDETCGNVEPVQASLLEDAEPNKARASTPTPTAARLRSAQELRLDAGEGDDSPTIACLEVKGGQVVEVSEGFAKSMQPIYPGVDVHGELLRAAEWCRGKPERRKTARGARSFLTGWLSRSSQRREVTMAVVAAGNARNGFGLGGGYTCDATPANSHDGKHGAGELDDFADLVAAAQSAQHIGQVT